MQWTTVHNPKPTLYCLAKTIVAFVCGTLFSMFIVNSQVLLLTDCYAVAIMVIVNFETKLHFSLF